MTYFDFSSTCFKYEEIDTKAQDFFLYKIQTKKLHEESVLTVLMDKQQTKREVKTYKQILNKSYCMLKN